MISRFAYMHIRNIYATKYARIRKHIRNICRNIRTYTQYTCTYTHAYIFSRFAHMHIRNLYATKYARIRKHIRNIRTNIRTYTQYTQYTCTYMQQFISKHIAPDLCCLQCLFLSTQVNASIRSTSSSPSSSSAPAAVLEARLHDDSHESRSSSRDLLWSVVNLLKSAVHLPGLLSRRRSPSTPCKEFWRITKRTGQAPPPGVLPTLLIHTTRHRTDGSRWGSNPALYGWRSTWSLLAASNQTLY